MVAVGTGATAPSSLVVVALLALLPCGVWGIHADSLAGPPAMTQAPRGRQGSSVRRVLEEEVVPENVLNVGIYVGSGYDVYFGDPFSEGVDPGFRASIFDLNSYEEGKTTSDGRFIVPDGVELRQCSACTTSFESTVIDSMEAFKEERTTEVKVEARVFFFSFSASHSSKDTQERIEKNNEVAIESKASCCVYSVHVLGFDRPYFTPNFERAVAEMSELTEMSEDGRKQFWGDFFDEFGTHIVLTTNMGGRFGTRTHKKMSSLFQSQSHSESSSAGFSMGTLNVDGSNADDKNKASSNKKQTESVTTFSVGGLYDPDREVWIKNVKAEPMPISIPETRPMNWLFNPRMFPDDPNIFKKHDHMVTGLGGYCELLKARGDLANCDPSVAMRAAKGVEFPVFKGMYFHSDTTFSNPNPWMNAPLCPPDATPQVAAWITRAMGSKGFLKWCMQKDATLATVLQKRPNFGGMYTHVPSSEEHSFVNPITDDYTCPEGYKPHDIPLNFEYGNIDMSLQVCYLEPFNVLNPMIHQFGGIYVLQRASEHTHLGRVNPLTGSTKCPPQFQEYLVGEHLHGRRHQDSSIYLCKSKLIRK